MSTTSYTYQNAVNLLKSQGKFHISLGLERITTILNLLGNPQDDLKIIHVAGTNGKGSTCAMLASILKEAGYKTGVYTSPHLMDYTERLKINSQDISKDNFASLLFEVNIAAEAHEIHLTEFEILTAMAFLYFKREKTDVVVLETGLGGRLDATNVVKTPLLSVITSIDIDHIDRLGDSIRKIASEKAGIIKANRPVVVSGENKGFNVILNRAKELNAPVVLANSNGYISFEKQSFKNSITVNDIEYEIPMLGLWQTQNLPLVLKAVEMLEGMGFSIGQKNIKNGLKNTVWHARMQYIREHNMLIDGAHNLGAAKLLRKSLDFYFPDKKLIWIYGSLPTKDYKSVIKILFKKKDSVICTEISGMNFVLPDELKQTILNETACKTIYMNTNIKNCITEFTSNNIDDCLVIVAGSLYLAGYVLAILDLQDN